jgi:hypothetical protein
MYMDKLYNRVHTRTPRSARAMSTLPNLKEIQEGLAEQRAARRSPLMGALLARGISGNGLRDFIVRYYNGEDPTRLVLSAGNALGIHQDAGDLADGDSGILDTAVEQLRADHPTFRAAVKWLCSPKRAERNEAEFKAARASGKWRMGRYPEVNSENESFLSYFEEHGLRHFKLTPLLIDGRLSLEIDRTHLVDLFCAYLLNECNARDLAEMPLKICRRCEKLFSSDLESAAFCSSKCREKSFWDPERKRDYNKVRRWETYAENSLKQKHGFTLADLDRLKAITSKNQVLDKISARWKDWSKITEKIERIRAAIR